MNAADVKIGITNGYVALEDYTTPIKYFLDDTFYWETIPSYR